MSRTIDERVVSMEFDNKRFEKNVQTSLSTLDKLKQSLKLKDASKGLENVQTAAKKCDLAPLSSACQTVGLKFNAMYTIADQALRNIVNSAMAAGKRVAAAFTIDPVKTGFAEYETQIGAVQTILANTSGAGKTLDDVNVALDELNTYADKTIYNFTEMTRNIGTFTAAGVDLDKAVTSIKGIANLAAVSGSTSQQASTAMYQLSQALAAGKVSLMDWNSVVNAGMGGKVFQEALTRTADKLGKNATEMIEKYGSFRESLTKGEWLTAEVLTETLTQLSGAYTEAQLIEQGYTKEQAKAITELADTAVNAATKVKTFTQLMDTLKEAAQSGWTQTWELIVGDFEEAKELWTNISDAIGGFISSSAESRNRILGGALNSNWDKLTDKIKAAGIETETFENKVKEVAKAHNIDVEKIIAEHGSLEKAFQNGAIKTDILKEALEGLGKSASNFNFDKVKRELKNGLKGEDVKEVEKALESLGYKLTGKDGKYYGDDGYFGTLTRDAVKEFQKAKGLKVTGIVDEETLEALRKATTLVGKLEDSIFGLVDEVDKLGGRQLLIESFKNIFEAISNIVTPVKDAFKAIFDPLSDGEKAQKLYNLIDGFHGLTESFKLWTESEKGKAVIESITSVFKGLFSVVDTGWKIIKSAGEAILGLFTNSEGLGDGISTVIGKIGEAINGFAKWINKNDRLVKGVKDVIKWIGDGVKAVSDWITAFFKLERVQNIIDGIKNVFKDLKNSIDNLSFENIGKSFTNFIENIKNKFKNNKNGKGVFTGITDGIKGFGDDVKKLFENAGVNFDKIKTKIIEFATVIKNYLGDNAGGILALGALVSIFFIFKKIGDMIGLIAKPFAALDDISETIQNFGKTMKTKMKAESMKSIAIAIGILAASVAVLAMVPPGQLWSAVGAITVMGGILAGLMFLMKKIGDVKLPDMAKLAGGILSISGSLLIFAIAAKVISGIDEGGLLKAGAILLGFVGLVKLLPIAMKGMSGATIAGFGVMVSKLSKALLIMSIAIAILGNMKTETLLKGGAAVVVFLGTMVGMMAATKLLAKNIPAFAGMMAGLSASLLIMSVAVGILGNMKTETLLKGGIAILAFLGMMVGMMAATKLLAADIPKFGSVMLGLSFGLLAMASAIKILASINNADLIKGGIVVTAFLGAMVGMMAATKLLTKQSENAAKIGLMMLSFAGAMIVLTGAIAILSLIKPADIAKAVIAIGAVGMIFAAMVELTKNAQAGDVNKTIIAMATAVGVLAVSIAALSLIDGTKLAGATVALSTVIGMFALLIASTEHMGEKVMGRLIVMTGIVAILGGIVYLLSTIESGSASKVAIGLSALILSLSASCALLSAVGKTGPLAMTGVKVLAGVLGVLAGFAALAIWQLPNIATQLSKFMTNLDPFITGLGRLNNINGMDTLKKLAESIATFVGSAGVFAVTDIVTFGGMGRAFSSFGSFIKEVLPTVNDVASSISSSKVKIDSKKLDVILDAVSTLAESSSKIPTSKIAGAITKFGVGGYIDIPNFDGFVTWLESVVPIVTGFGATIKETKINSSNARTLISLCDAVGILASAASAAPSVDVAGGFAKFPGGAAGGGYISIPNLSGFSSWLEGVIPIITGFSADIKETKLTSKNADDLVSICKAVEILGKAADSAPTIDVAAGFAKFAGGAAGGAYIGIPDLEGFSTWLQGVVPLMTGFSADIKETKISSANASTLVSIADAVKILGDAADAAPTITVAAGFAKFAGGIGGGAYVDIPLLEGFTGWLDQSVPIITGFASDIKETKITDSNAATLVSIANAVKILGEAASAAPNATIAGGFATIGPLFAAGGYMEIPQLKAFAEWLDSAVPVITAFASDIKETKITDSNAATLVSIANGAKILAEAASAAPSAEAGAMVGVIGPAIVAGAYVKSADLEAFGNWIATVAPVMSSFASDIKESSITEEHASVLIGICKAAKILAESAESAPKKEEYTSIFGKWVESADIESLGEWIKTVVKVLQEVSKSLAEGVSIDANLLMGLGTAAKSLSEALAILFAAYHAGSGLDSDSLNALFVRVAQCMVDFYTKIGDINVANLSLAASAALSISQTMNNLSNFDYSTVDAVSLGGKLTDISGAMKTFSDDISGVDVSSASSKVKSILDLFKEMAVVDFNSVTSFENALSKLAESGISSFTDTFVDSSDKITKAAANMIDDFVSGVDKNSSKAKKAVSKMADDAADECDSYSKTEAQNAGRDLVTGFANGISARTWYAEAKAAAMARAAIKAAEEELDEHSPSRVFYRIGEFAGIGFANAFADYESKAYKAGSGIANAAKTGLSNAISKVRDIVENGMDSQPTIRPVLDLSEVANGAGAINGMFGMQPSVGVMSNVRAINSMMNRNQNGVNSDVIAAINDLGKKIGTTSGDTYQVNGITYDDGTNISNAVKSLVRAAKVERRI